MQTLDFQEMEKIERSTYRKRTFFRWLLFLVLGLFAFYYLAPLYVMIVTSLKTMEEIRQGNLMSLPGNIIFDSWKTAWSGRGGIDAGNVSSTLLLELNKNGSTCSHDLDFLWCSEWLRSYQMAFQRR